MKKTCYNCRKFYNILADDENKYHIHNWCRQWNVAIETSVLADKFEYNGPYYDDLETGDAFCYLFEPRDEPAFDDEWFENNKRENIKNRIAD